MSQFPITISRNDKVNYKFMNKLEDVDGIVTVNNVIEAVWDNGNAFIAVSDKFFKVAQSISESKNEAELERMIDKMRKICKARKSEEFFIRTIETFTLSRHTHSTLEEAEASRMTTEDALGNFDKKANQVDLMFEQENFKLGFMVPSK